MRLVAVSIERSQTRGADRSACRTAHPQQPMAYAIAAPIVGENSIGIRFDWHSFQAVIRRSASSSTWASVARRAAASLSAASRRRYSSILRRLKPITAA
jgi:hypothetical protein